MNDPIGSIWRRWDLHIHTPASFLWRSGPRLRDVEGAERQQVLINLVTGLNTAVPAAFAIMDYWTFDGYLALRDYLASPNSTKLDKVVFPGMELRCEAPADYRLNIHVILSDQLSKQQLADFKSTLRLRLVDRPLSDDALAAVARQLSPDKLVTLGADPAKVQADDREAAEVGSKVAVVSRDSLYDAIDTLPKDSALLVIPWEPYGGAASLDWKAHPVVVTEIMTRADAWESRKSTCIDLFHGRSTDDNRRYIENFLQSIGKPRPAISGSDAHSSSHYGHFPSNSDGERATWIKADLTFNGLRQIVNEPTARAYVGSKPSELVSIEGRSTRIIEHISIKKNADSNLEEEWFDANLPLNPFLVAIIGNKGSGKSALLDTLGPRFAHGRL